MFSFPSTRPHHARLATIVLIGTHLLGGVFFARAGEAPTPALPPSNELSDFRRALREFDRFLDHHPLLEDDLRLAPTLISDPGYLKKTPELRAFLGANPQVARGLDVYPRYFLYRALLRQAGTPLGFPEIAQLKDVFEQEPELAQLLAKTPESIRDPVFLAQHARLRAFLDQHAALRRVFLAQESSSPKKSP